MIDNKYLEFVEVGDTGKTTIWHVFSKTRGDILGVIKWYGPWRQYVFHPKSQTIWNKDCLDVIRGFIIEEMEMRKVRKL